ncbi:hypothetical protein AX769_16465 [Frondihabitans sp. PAMC 28766]|nr:hypothetical protein AX769_16465 [Frondihabitans sp. PAMC 28766]
MGVVVSAIALVAALAGCTQTGSSVSEPGSISKATSTPAAAVSATGTGWTVGAKTGPAPVTLVVQTPTGEHGVDVTVSCPGTGAWVATNTTSSISRHGVCDKADPTLVPIIGTPSSVTIDVSAATGGQKFSAKAVATTTRFRQDAALAAFCKAYSVPDSTTYNADLSYQKHLSTAAQWQQERAEAASQLDTIASKPGDPGWAATATSALREAVLAAPAGAAGQADNRDEQTIGIACDNNSSSVDVQVTVPGQG